MTELRKEYVLRTGDFDRYGHIHPASVLDIFQDIAGDHAEQIGVGFQTMLAQNYLWVIVKSRYRIVKMPQLHQHVRVITWPLAPSRISFQREYRMEALDGTPLILGSSDWVIIDSQTRRFVNIQNIYPTGEPFRTDTVFPEKTKRLPILNAEESGYTLVPTYTDLDQNGHVNNTKYANYILNAIQPDESTVIHSFQMDYHKEIRAGEPLTIYFTREDDKILAVGRNEANDAMFAAELGLS